MPGKSQASVLHILAALLVGGCSLSPGSATEALDVDQTTGAPPSSTATFTGTLLPTQQSSPTFTKTPSPSATVTPTPSIYAITFVYYEDETPGLFTINSDGSGFEKQSPDFKHSEYPEWSPDGRMLSFRSFFFSPFRVRLYVVNPETGEIITQIEHIKDFNWAPDGSGFAFTLVSDYLTMYSGELYLAFSPDWIPHRLMETVDNIGRIQWSPSSDQILTKLSDRGTGAGQTVLINMDGSISYLDIDAGWPTWDPTGQMITYSYRDGLFYQIRIFDVRSGVDRALTKGGNHTEIKPRWSPSGKYVAFIRGEHGAGKPGIYVYTIETGTTRRVSPRDKHSAWYAWSPDGEYLALLISKSSQGKCALYIHSMETERSRELVKDSVECTDPAWRPQ